MRFLCLHGAGTNAEIFELQSGGITSELEKQGHSFKFINGRMESEAQAEFKNILDGPFYNHYTRDTAQPGETVSLALKHLHQIVERDGPFDAVMGFSQGAALACSLIIQQAKLKRGPLFKCAVFICAAAPFTEDGLKLVPPGKVLVDIPTAHIVGKQDGLYAHGMQLYGFCEPAKAVVYDHGGGHSIPFDGVRTEKMVGVVEEVVRRAS